MKHPAFAAFAAFAVRVVVPLFVCTCLLNQVHAQVPIGEAPQWRLLQKSEKSTVEFETTGVYTKGDFTYVAFRELEKDHNDAYVLTVHAFDCKHRRVSMALLGRLSLDGKKAEHESMASETVMAKYSSKLPVPEFAHLTPADKQVCRRK